MKKAARWLFGKIKNCRMLQRMLQKEREKMGKLFPGESTEIQLENYWSETIVLLLKLGITGGVVVFFVYMSATGNDITFLERPTYGEGMKQIDLEVYGESGTAVEKTLQVAEKLYSDAELEVLCGQLWTELEKVMIGNNMSLNCIKTDMSFPGEVEGFPFQIKWNTNDTDVISRNGKLRDKSIKEETTVEITAVISCEEYKSSRNWTVQVVPARHTEEELWEQKIDDALQKTNAESLTEEIWLLPDELGGEEVRWRTRNNNSAVKILFLLGVSMLLVLWGRRRELDKKLQERDVLLEEEYRNIVTRLVLYLGAGMAMKSAFRKIAFSGTEGKKQSIVLKEMILTCREMEDGVYESVCYENFGQRCGRAEYVKLGTLLSQNIRNGNKELLCRLQEEVRESGEAQKFLIKRRGEEASTKMLGPMVLLLGVTMVLIMIPAFYGIG